ncbi:hypothetical protein AB0J35_32000 [Nonomuraea angiospora]|jgi:hypothetical protein|uniref:hypothetical protein n=2 Tax=Nonomuraea TaxID=83681 RepID=UPI00342629F1
MIHHWRRQERIAAGPESGLTSSRAAEPAAARRRITVLENEPAIARWAIELLPEQATRAQVRPRARQSLHSGGPYSTAESWLM